MKRFTAPIIAVLVTVLFIQTVTAADIAAGHVFTAGEQNITHVEMNDIVGAAVINTAFYTTKSALDPDGADVFLYYSIANSAFRKTTLNAAVINNIDIITTQSEDGSPSYADFVLTYDTSGGTLRKVSLQNLISPSGFTNQFSGFATTNTPSLADFVPLLDGVVNLKTTISNLFVSGYAVAFTNRTELTAPAITDQFFMWDGANFLTKKMTVGTMRSNIMLRFVSQNYAIPNLSSVSTNIFLGGAPDSVRWVLVYTNNATTGGYVSGDEVAVSEASRFTGGEWPMFTEWANSTNVGIATGPVALLTINVKTGGGITNMTSGNFNLKCYASRWQP